MTGGSSDTGPEFPGSSAATNTDDPSGPKSGLESPVPATTLLSSFADESAGSARSGLAEVESWSAASTDGALVAAESPCAEPGFVEE
jgi:hypothetical protein